MVVDEILKQQQQQQLPLLLSGDDGDYTISFPDDIGMNGGKN